MNMKWGKIPPGTLIILYFTMVATIAMGGGATPLNPSQRDKCPVCGMFVAKYPDWVGEILYKDGKTVFFDGAKDLFKYYFNIKKYNPEKSQDDIAAIYVTEYYDLSMISAHDAYYVIGSDVYGPMGRELIPLKTQGDAEEFKKDHRGKRMVRFKEVTPKLILRLD